MLIAIIPKLPMRDIVATRKYYVSLLGFALIADYGDYLMIERDDLEIFAN